MKTPFNENIYILLKESELESDDLIKISKLIGLNKVIDILKNMQKKQIRFIKGYLKGKTNKDLQQLEEIIGKRNVRKICSAYPKLVLYVPSITFFKLFVRRYISMYPDKTQNQISEELGTSELFINQQYQILKNENC